MRCTGALVWGRVGPLVDGGSTLGADRGETVEGTGGEKDGEASAKMVAK